MLFYHFCVQQKAGRVFLELFKLILFSCFVTIQRLLCHKINSIHKCAKNQFTYCRLQNFSYRLTNTIGNLITYDIITADLYSKATNTLIQQHKSCLAYNTFLKVIYIFIFSSDSTCYTFTFNIGIFLFLYPTHKMLERSGMFLFWFSFSFKTSI